MDEESETEVSQVDEVAALLSEVAEVHAMVFRITDGEDADWASWYTKWLLELSEFPDLMGDEIPPSHLVYELVRLDREYVENQPDEAWEMYYAERLLDTFATDSDEDDVVVDDEFDDDDLSEDDEFDEEEDDVVDVDVVDDASSLRN